MPASKSLQTIETQPFPQQTPVLSERAVIDTPPLLRMSPFARFLAPLPTATANGGDEAAALSQAVASRPERSYARAAKTSARYFLYCSLEHNTLVLSAAYPRSVWRMQLPHRSIPYMVPL